ncbi:MAG TPA: hypothetical protein VGW10_09640 [Solirubrobacteraceae bacterium]|nr:hypothetical protein [Solirubrobacteraceae bacterium]
MVDERRIAAAALVVAPGLFLLSNLLHPTELATGNEPEQLAAIADDYQRWQAAHAISLASLMVFALAVAGLALLVARSNARTARAGGALGLAGLIGLGGALAIDGFAWGIAGEVWGKSDAPGKLVAETVLDDMQHSEWALMFYLTGVLWILGMMLLSLGAARAGLVPMWAAALLILGTIMVGLETSIHSNVYFVIAAAVLLAGGIAMALHLREPPEVAA